MRVLWCTTSMESVFTFGLPIAQALRRAGHEILVATGPDFVGRAEHEGFAATVAGPPAAEAAMAAMGDPLVAASPPEESWHFPVAMFGRQIAPAKYAELRRIGEEWRPDLVLHAPVDLAGALFAASHDLPSLSYGFGQHVERPMLEGFAERVSRLWEKAGLDPDPWAGIYRGTHLDPCPPGLQRGWCPPGTALRHISLPIPGDADGQLPEWFESRPGRPIVYLGLGTVPIYNRPDAFRSLLLPFAARSDIEVVATVSRLYQPDMFGEQPAHVHVESWLSLAALFPHCAASICHAGSGTTLAALTAGLPLVVWPQGADQYANARACSDAGVARIIGPDDIPALPAIVGELVAPDAPEAKAAQQIAADVAAMPDPDETVAELGYG